MFDTIRTCTLRCVNNSHKPIKLPDNEEVIIGRNELTGIRDPSISRNQLILKADLDSCTVIAVCFGGNPSGINGFCIRKHTQYILHHMDRLELVLDKYIHEIIFEPPPELLRPIVPVKRMNIEQPGVVAKKPNLQSLDETPGWEEIDDGKLLIFTAEGVKSSYKIAAYDLDGTIASPKSGAKFPKDAEDWKFIYPEVPKKLRQLHKDGYKLVIFTNQKGISTGKTSKNEFKKKVKLVLDALKIPMQVFVATGKGIYRKPIIGMWNVLCQQKNNGIDIDMDQSFYCGDAAGRDNNWAPKKKKDHSIADRLFALNIGLKFKTPEEHFLSAKIIDFRKPDFNPKSITKAPLLIPEDSTLTSDEQELIVLVGSPGSGKSFICKKYLVPKGYVHVNRDQLGSWQKCVNAAESALQKKLSVVIDNTNPDKESRKRYINLAQKYNIPCRCFQMNTTIHQIRHNNVFREITDKNHQTISDIIINSYRKNLIEPTLEEGFNEIIKVNCIPKFENPDEEKLYNMYLLEK